jgi:hypothetical protein|mmetsp:Transcript_12068/g.26468  ORF Transcript_12068/g.26468 Transcript_12068/m.26468 type:complete len:161 (-) Transcript_12068:475-957(-)
MLHPGKDKLYHIIACSLITMFTFTLMLAGLKVYERWTTTDTHHSCASDEQLRDEENINNNAHKCEFYRTLAKKTNTAAFVAGFFALSIGIMKEVGDIFDIWWVCKGEVGCSASWADLLADFIGVVIGEGIIFTALLILYQLKHPLHRDVIGEPFQSSMES